MDKLQNLYSVAVVLESPSFYSFMIMIMAMVSFPFVIKIFRNLEEAEFWLLEKQSEFVDLERLNN